jgi:hypothetical protein
MTDTGADAGIVLILANHQRLNDGGPCLCGWNELGHSHVAHQVDALREHKLVRDEPNPEQWVTTAAAAKLLRVHLGTVYRYVNDGYLTRYNPDGAVKARAASPMFWRPEVERLAANSHPRRRRRDPAPKRCGCGLDPRYAAPEAHDSPCRYRSVLALP